MANTGRAELRISFPNGKKGSALPARFPLRGRCFPSQPARSGSVSCTQMTMTFAPTGTCSYSSITSSLRIRMQPEDTAWPMVQGWFVP